MRFIFILAAMWLALALSVKAQDYNAGLDAYDAGDYATALAEWRPLADRGVAAAQFNIGLMYANGRGVPQDYAEAEQWYRRAAEQGNTDALTNLAKMDALDASFADAVTLAI